MTNYGFQIFRTVLITVATLGMMASLTEFRFRGRRLLTILFFYLAWVAGSTAVLVWVGGEILLIRLLLFTISIPAVCLTYWAAKDTPSQAVFNYATQILVSLLGASLIRMLTDGFGLAPGFNILLMVVFYTLVICLEWRFLRNPFRRLVMILPTGWNVLTFIPSAFCAYIIFVAAWPGLYLENPFQRVYAYTALIPMAVVYVAIFKSLSRQYYAQCEQQNAALLVMQVSALRQKLQKEAAEEEAQKILRHDLRHRLHTAAELAARGETEALLKFLDSSQQSLNESQPVRWCTPPIMDAVFSSYFDQAKKQGIRVEADISLPSALPVDEGELAIVLANALENAIHANMELPWDGRKLRCKMVGTPGVMLEISNPCAGHVSFDSDGLPVTREEGHGLGTQSIRAFCRKNGAVCQFDLPDGWFRLRLVL